MKLEQLMDVAKSIPAVSGNGTAWDDVEVRRAFGLRRAELAGLRAMNYANLSRYARGETPGSESSLVKLYTNDVARSVQELALDILGPNLLDDAGRYAAWTKLFLDGIVLSIGGGTPEIQREIIADRVLSLPRSR
jgi:alkylation response protein AidB-like acyl-CoA dehydrogenase